MGWVRCIVVAPEAKEADIIQALQPDFKFKKLIGLKERSVIAYEGRAPIPLNDPDILTMGIDSRSVGYCKLGSYGVGDVIEAHLVLTIGILIKSSKKNSLPSDIKEAFDNMIEEYGGDEVNDDTCWGYRFDLHDYEALGTVEEIEGLSEMLTARKIPFSAAIFKNGYGEKLGTLDCSSSYVGPEARVEARWKQKKGSKKTSELVLNGEGSFLDGEEIKELAHRW